MKLDNVLPFVESILKDPYDDTNLHVFADWLQESDFPKFNKMGLLLHHLLNRYSSYYTSAFPWCGRYRHRIINLMNDLPFGKIENCSLGILSGHYGDAIFWNSGFKLFANEDGVKAHNTITYCTPIKDFIRHYPEMESLIVDWMISFILLTEEWLYKRDDGVKESRQVRLVLGLLCGSINGLSVNNVRSISKKINSLFEEAERLEVKGKHLLTIRYLLKYVIQKLQAKGVDDGSDRLLVELYNDRAI